MVRYSPTPAASTRWRSTGSIIVDTGPMRRALNVVVMVASWDIVPVGSLARSFGTVVTLSSPLVSRARGRLSPTARRLVREYYSGERFPRPDGRDAEAGFLFRGKSGLHGQAAR